MASRASNVRKLALWLSSTALLAIGVTSAMASGVGDYPLTPQQQAGLFLAPAVPTTTRIGSYTPPRVNRACPTPRPQLSEEQQHRDIKGDVVIGVYVSPHGRAKKITVAQSSGFEDLDNAAAASAATWHYIPATLETAAVSGWTAVKFRFAAQDASQQSSQPAESNKDCT
ncbi:MAG TPA: energy transducer TonB [Rhizomicrobium sp.]|nr:energy transducer TonB [Rhizomicrobium sp.]